MQALIMDSLIIFLLVISISYAGMIAYQLRKLKKLRKDSYESMGQFNQSLTRASKLLNQIKANRKEISSTLIKDMEKANRITNDLHIMIDVGNKLADKLEKQIVLRRKNNNSQNQINLNQQEIINKKNDYQKNQSLRG